MNHQLLPNKRVLLKIGGYGIWVLHNWFNYSVSCILAIISMVGGSLCRIITLAQTDIKSLIAYSSVVHISMVTFSILIWTHSGNIGALAIIIGHGICSRGLFLTATLNYSRIRTRSLILRQGALFYTPRLALIWVLLILINFSCPPSITLLSEVLAFYLGIRICRSVWWWLGVMIVIALIFRVVLFYSQTHGQSTTTLPASSERVKELTLTRVHSNWWLLRPLVLHILE